MRNTLPICLVILMSTPMLGCFNSKHETREVPSSTTTIEHRSSVETVPAETEVRKHTTVERTY